mmetsp:Transcript_8434/g.16798  ORF Transcript_8434/g.16798 Transcript_8434/m.16798 type:complete len:385 (+) Transcript_8434:377-1531(+)
MHCCHCKIRFPHLVCQPVHLLLCVAKNHCLSHCQRIIQVTECIKLPFLFFYRDKKLFDPLQRQLIPLNQNPDWIVHKLPRHLEYFHGQSSRHQHHLRLRGQIPVNIINLFFETLVEHLIRLINDKCLQRPSNQISPLDQIVHPTRSPRHHMQTALQYFPILPQTLPSDTGMALDIHEIPQRTNNPLRLLRQLPRRTQNQHLGIATHSLIQKLQRRYRKDGGFSSAGLGLRNHIPSSDDGTNGPLLNRRWFFEAVGVDSAQEGGFEIHGIEGRAGSRIVVGRVVATPSISMVTRVMTVSVTGGVVMSLPAFVAGGSAEFILGVVAVMMTARASIVVGVFAGGVGVVGVAVAAALGAVIFVVGGVVAIAMTAGGAAGPVFWHDVLQ